MLIRVSFPYNRIELNILLSHLEDSFFLEKSLFVAMIKAKSAKNKAILEALIVDLLKSNEIATTKKIVNMHKCKNYKFINKSKEKCYLNDNKHYKLN